MSEAEQGLVLAGHYFTPAQLARLEAIKRETGTNKSYLVRQALDAYLTEYDRQRQERRAEPAIIHEAA